MITLADFAQTDRQKQIVIMSQTKSWATIAKELGLSRGTVSNTMAAVKRHAAKQGYSPEHDMDKPCPTTHFVKGTSTLYKEGEPVLQWVKTQADADRLVEAAKEMAEAITSGIKPIKPAAKPKAKLLTDKMTVYPIGDAHVGLYAWNEDAEEDWDCDKIESVMLDCFSQLLASSPNTKEALLINLGDWFHTDTPENVTRRSGHTLDVDTRWARVVRVGVRLMLTMIDSLLRKHESIKVINEIGNHDDQTSIMLSHVIEAHYRNEPRVKVDTSPDVFHWHEWGNSLIGVHHGHKCKPSQLYQVMAEDKREECGRLEHRCWYTGHIHHEKKVDVGGQSIESFRTLIPRDTYAHSSGYRSNRSICSITHDIQHGECSRQIVHVNSAKEKASAKANA